jgi:hypothetical protein
MSAEMFVDVCVGLLNLGQSVRFQANGWSMHPTIQDGETILVEPVSASQVKRGDIVLYRTPRGVTAHRIDRVVKDTNSVLNTRSSSRDSFHSVHSPQHSSLFFLLRGDSLDAFDSPVTSDQILGKVVSVERNGRPIDLTGKRAKALWAVHSLLFCSRRRLARLAREVASRLPQAIQPTGPQAK